MRSLAILMLALALSGAALARETKSYSLGSAGTMQLDIEDGWKETPAPPDSGAAISIAAKTAGQMNLLLTPLPGAKSDDVVKQEVKSTADRVGPDSVEKTLTLQPLRGAETRGYYFKATDPAPKPGDYKFMYQGVVAVGSNLFVTFIVLYNGGAEKDADAALAAVKGLRLAKTRA